MQAIIGNVLALAAISVATPAAAQVTLYEREGFRGRSYTSERSIRNLEREGFNDRASSIEVRGEPWEVCDDARFNGRCFLLRPGRYPSLTAMGLNDRISSVRAAGSAVRAVESRYPQEFAWADDYRRHDEDDRRGSATQAVESRYPQESAWADDYRRYDADYGRRGNEPLYEVRVSSARAVMGSAGQHCWVEREQVSSEYGSASVPGALVGAVVGGILGHQVGGGSGRDIATVGGAVAGAVVGANVGRDRNGQSAQTQDVQRCSGAQYQGRPDYWDVTYNFRGQDHRMQMTSPPGPTVFVNDRGEPRS